MLFLLVACTAVVVVTCALPPMSSNDATRTEIIAELPSQPMVFNTPDELRTYLQELDKYFAIVGRPRYNYFFFKIHLFHNL